MNDDETVEIEASIVHETGKAWLLDTEIGNVWIPKSQAEDNDDGTFSLSAWIADQKGFT